MTLLDLARDVVRVLGLLTVHSATENPFRQDAPPGSLQITGVLGLAAVLYGLYHFQGPARSKGRGRSQRWQGDASTDEASSSGLQNTSEQAARRLGREQNLEAGPSSPKAAQAPGKQQSWQEVSWAVRSRLPGVKFLTISALGVLLEEWTPLQLQEGATLRDDAAAILYEIAQIATVYIITQVEDDTGEATCRGALEAGGLVGSKSGQIPPHRLLFCSTLDGKVSIVRQLEPQLHIDGHPKTVDDLKRFIKLVHICGPNDTSAGLGSPNVGFAYSLPDLFSAG